MCSCSRECANVRSTGIVKGRLKEQRKALTQFAQAPVDAEITLRAWRWFCCLLRTKLTVLYNQNSMIGPILDTLPHTNTVADFWLTPFFLGKNDVLRGNFRVDLL